MSKKVVIIGGVAGGATAAARLRRLDETAEIVLIERGEYISYANCGLPYHVSGVIRSRDALLLQTPSAMMKKFNMDVRVKQEVVEIDRESKSVTVKKADGETYQESYDTLVLATGSSPLRPPIPGIDGENILTLWTVPDTDRLKARVQDGNVKRAVVVGGGFIGLEVAENLRHLGIEVTIVEMLDQVMAPLDYEMAKLLHENIEQNGVKLSLGDGVSAFSQLNGSVRVELKSGKHIDAELAVLAIGVRPNSELMKAAGLKLNARGGVVVDEYLRTSDPDIYAVGDVIEVEDFILKGRTMVPLAGPANKQGRIAANNIAGGKEKYEGTQGSSVVKVFDLTAASTGLNEKTLVARGLTRGKDYESVTILQNSHAGYYPGAVPMTLKLLFSMDGQKLFGAQIVGTDGVDKRIDTIGVTIRLGGGVEALKSLELAYAPPYSSAKDPVNMLGFVAGNVLDGKVKFAAWDAAEKSDKEKTILLDVREDSERMAFSVPNAVGLPLGQLRMRLHEFDREKEIIVFCAIGVRAYNAARILMEHGFKNVKVYPGGSRFYMATHYESLLDVPSRPVKVEDSGQETHANAEHVPAASIRLDCSGLQCPGPIMKVFESMKDMEDGQAIEVTANDPGFSRDIVAWSRRTGNTLVLNEKRGNDYVALVQKGGTEIQAAHEKNGKTIIVFSNDLDKVLASFIIANGAAAMGRPVTMFFTFWGLSVLRKPEKVSVKKSFVETMFGLMMPRGVHKLKLSNLNMLGMGSSMMKSVMRKKNVDSLTELMEKAKRAGVKLVACTMSMDVMGIRAEELIDGVELAGVGTYLGDAEESNVNLFM
jgi:NADPH-dependent 2,4-dienoyl-CoA reductase/sulfur reductase-like enzyme/peroxiredoxin family protein/TusA-related sulfurtransferase/rhodanese-related sulfurtransferase